MTLASWVTTKLLVKRFFTCQILNFFDKEDNFSEMPHNFRKFCFWVLKGSYVLIFCIYYCKNVFIFVIHIVLNIAMNLVMGIVLTIIQIVLRAYHSCAEITAKYCSKLSVVIIVISIVMDFNFHKQYHV